MFRIIAARALWMTKGAALFGGAVVTLALVLGVVTMAAAAVPGDPFRLGQTNGIDNISTLVGSASGALLRINNEGDGPALDLRVESGEAPMTVNSTKRVNALNADQLDGKSAAQLEVVNGLRVARDTSEFNSASEKYGIAICNRGVTPTTPLGVVGTGYAINGANGTQGPADVVVTAVRSVTDDSGDPDVARAIYVRAVETKPVAANWSVTAEAYCARSD